MLNVNLGYVRINLTCALQNVIPSSVNQIVNMGASLPGREKFYKRPTRKISLGDRSVVVAAEPVGCSETRAYKGSQVLISPEAYEMASWRRVVPLLPPVYQAWTHYCYGDSLDFNKQTIICQHVWTAFIAHQHQISAPRMSKKTSSMVQQLVWLAVQDSKNIANRDKPKYSTTDLAVLSGVAVDSWCKTYYPRWQALLRVVEALDQEALTYAEQKHTASCIY